jgi:type III pantothenate kinase
VLLGIDVGNTETKLGFFTGEPGKLKLRKTWRITTALRRTSDEFGIAFAALFRRAEIPTESVRNIVISSVVPQLDRELAEMCRHYFAQAAEPITFSAATQNLLTVATDRPKELGSDLLAGAIAARSLHGDPVIAIGFGTATTFSAVAGGKYLGAAIAPGIQISIDALAARTAKLPQVSLETIDEVIGRDTVSALQAGIVFGFVGQTEGIVARMRREIGETAKVIATGGLADIIAKHTRTIEAVEPFLVLHGLREYFESRAGGPASR